MRKLLTCLENGFSQWWSCFWQYNQLANLLRLITGEKVNKQECAKRVGKIGKGIEGRAREHDHKLRWNSGLRRHLLLEIKEQFRAKVLGKDKGVKMGQKDSGENEWKLRGNERRKRIQIRLNENKKYIKQDTLKRCSCKMIFVIWSLKNTGLNYY